jgi:hypothetical protein
LSAGHKAAKEKQMVKKIWWRPAFMAVLVGLALSSAGCAIFGGALKLTASEELPNPYEVQTGEIKDIDGDIKTQKLNLINLPQGVKHKNNQNGETVEQISALTSSRNGENVYMFMSEYPRHCLHVKIDDAPSVEMVSEKRDGDIVLTNTLFPIPSAMLESLRNCKTLVLQAENVKYKNETVDYKSAIMTVEPAAIEVLHTLLE